MPSRGTAVNPFDHFPPITIEMPEVSIMRGGIRFPKFGLVANGLPVAIKGGHGLMVRLCSHWGYEAGFTCHHLDVHDQDGLLTVRVKGVLRGSGDAHLVELLHLESRHDATGIVASILQAATAERRTIKARRRSGLGTFRLELFRPPTV